MPQAETPLDLFLDLTWSDLEDWAGTSIADRGRRYQKRGRVTGLAATETALIAWVNGSQRYSTKVVVDEDGLPDSVCSCPFALDCKHGVAVVLEYLRQVEKGLTVHRATTDDERLAPFRDTWKDKEVWDRNEIYSGETTFTEKIPVAIDDLLKHKTKPQLIALIHDLARRFPELAQDLADHKQLETGDARGIVTHLTREIKDMAEEPGWQEEWHGEGFIPDYSGIRSKLQILLNRGHPDEVLELGCVLIKSGTHHVEMSHDEGETGMEIASCMPIVVEALEQSSLTPSDRLSWVLDATHPDQFDLCEALYDYLDHDHPQEAWSVLADRLLAQLKDSKLPRGRDDFNGSFSRDRLSDWTIRALERAGRDQEIIPLCETETEVTGSYERLAQTLIDAGRFEDAEHWIHRGILATRDKRAGVTSSLREKLRKIRTQQEDWPAVAAMRVEEFLRWPSLKDFTSCQEAAEKANCWTEVRDRLLEYLETGEFPLTKDGWPLPVSGLDAPESGRQENFPQLETLIRIAIHEKNPDEVLRWYDRRPNGQFAGVGIDTGKIATAVQKHSPERAVAIWRGKAERLIAQVEPRAYQEAARYLGKAAKVMTRQKKQTEWNRYLAELRARHHRKYRLMEILDGLEGRPIVNRRG